MKQVFHISFPEKEIIQPVLAMQIGKKHLAFAITEQSTGELKQLGYYTCPSLDEIILEPLLSSDPILDYRFQRVNIGYRFPQVCLVPFSHFRHDQQSALLKTLFGVHSPAHSISEALPVPIDIDRQFHTIYAVPSKIYEQVRARFPVARYWHPYSLVIKNNLLNGICLDFTQEDFSAVVTVRNKLLFAGTFSYSTPADVLYHVLKIVHHYKLFQQQTKLLLSGLIDKNSALYAELLQYFLQVEFLEARWSTDQPAHYFTSLNELARCE